MIAEVYVDEDKTKAQGLRGWYVCGEKQFKQIQRRLKKKKKNIWDLVNGWLCFKSGVGLNLGKWRHKLRERHLRPRIRKQQIQRHSIAPNHLYNKRKTATMVKLAKSSKINWPDLHSSGPMTHVFPQQQIVHHIRTNVVKQLNRNPANICQRFMHFGFANYGIVLQGKNNGTQAR